VWLLDETKLENRGNIKPEPKHEPKTAAALDAEDAADDEQQSLDNDATSPNGPRRRRRRRGPRQHNELPGNRGKHLAGGDEGGGE
jgi:hypothetical protein